MTQAQLGRPSKASSTGRRDQTSNHTVVLNHDVLRSIFWLLDNVSLLLVMRTSPAIYWLALEVLLARGVTLKSEEATSSFCAFMSAQDFSRAPLIRKFLELSFSTLSPTTAQALCSTLRRTTRLRKISIRDVDTLFRTAPELVQVLAELQYLEEVDVVAQKWTDCVLIFLATLRSRLTHLNVQFPSSLTPDNCGRSSEIIPIELLQRSAHTLRHIRIENVTLSAWADIVLPQVVHLHATAVQLPSTDVLARTLPNLVTLIVEEVYWDPEEPVDVDTAAARRCQNHYRQERYGSWPCLEWVTGPVVEVFSLGLVCPVYTLILESDRRSDMDWVMLETLLDFTPSLQELELTAIEDLYALEWPYNGYDAVHDLVEFEGKAAHWEMHVWKTQDRLRETF
ncbi:hypothetical protein OH76DRAFT_1558656, partial [Lentinus brumalis]